MRAVFIYDGVFLGDAEDCLRWAGWRMNVMMPYQLCRVPVCRPMPCLEGDVAEPSTFHVPRAHLEAIADYIEETRTNPSTRTRPLLVHCAMGIERSPLSVAWWMQKFHGFTLESAYEVIRTVRPIVQPREHWVRD